MNKWIRGTIAGLLLAALAGCGGGGAQGDGVKPGINSGSANGGNGAAQAGTVTLALQDAGGNAATTLSSGKPLVAVATVRDGKGALVVNTLVGFSIDPRLVIMNPAAGTVATDSAGQARITLSAASLGSSGAGLLEVAAIVGTGAVQTQSVITVGANKLALKLVTPASGVLTLKAYDSTVLTIDVLNDGLPFTGESVALDLGSLCAAGGKATLPLRVVSLNGRAQVVYRDQGCTQSDVITIGASGITIGLTVNVSVRPPDAASIQVVRVVPLDNAIVIKGAGGLGRTETATITFKVVDQFGNPLANQAVAFAAISTKPVTLGRAADSTDAAGEVSTTVNSGTEPTAVRVQATLANGLTTVSDTIAVTTGVPIQAAFSLSAETYNMEGFNYDNTHNAILILLADQFGNPVADGTPVVFQTDSGAIGSAGRGGCNTVNGACSVTLRSQNPRYDTDASAPQGRAGLATISVSTLSNTSTPLTGSLAVFMSGSFASRVSRIFPDGSSVPVAGSVAMSTTTCGAAPLRLRVSDSHYNPMPSGTLFEARAADRVQVLDIVPSSVASIAPRMVNGVVSGDQGSTHLSLIQPDQALCVPGGANTTTGSAIIQITTPHGNVTPVAVTLTFPSA
ncbi:MAG: hypothetical protein V4631_21835 [Pseudomonadota bacterium]